MKADSLAHEGPSPVAVFLRIARGFWSGAARKRAWILTFAVFVFSASVIGAQYATTVWHKLFFNSLEGQNIAGIWSVLAWLPLLVLAHALAISGLVVSRMLFQARWREWLTDRMAGWWVADQRYYRLNVTYPEMQAPEYRIADDLRLSVEPLAEFTIGLATALATALTFVSLLWTLGGSLTVSLGGLSFTLPAYMAIAALIYSGLTSLGAWLAGRPLVGQVAKKNQAEAEFRAEMTRLRENAESIALVRGDPGELAGLRERYALVLRAWLRIIRQNGIIASVYNVNGALYPIVPLLLAAPKYLSGALTLGEVMQATAAFSAVLSALNWFADNFVRLAEWLASVRRVGELVSALEAIDIATTSAETERITIGESPDESLHLRRLSVAHRDGRGVVDEASVSVQPGKKVLISGASGSGKSTLIRAIAGLWPWGSGEILLPRGAAIAFVPQKPYLPHGTLRAILAYPAPVESLDSQRALEALETCGLSYLAPRLEDETNWDQALSGGERQSIAFARLLLQRPDIIVLDEATAALDDERQRRLMTVLVERLPDAMVLSVGHRPGLEAFHQRQITLTPQKTRGARLSSRSLGGALRRLLETALKRP